MNVLITGGLGFIGSNLAYECLQQGHNVTLINKSERKRENIKGIEEKVELILKDIQDINESDVQGKDYIFHCASIVHNKPFSENPLQEIRTNCEGTIALLEACRKYNSSARIVYLSTFFVNGCVKNKDLPVNEDSSCKPTTIYSACKLAGENFAQIYTESAGINVMIARLMNVYGVREQKDNPNKGALNRMIYDALNGKEIKVQGDGSMKRDWIYISDVIRGCLKIAEKGEPGKVYYVGNGKGKSLNEVVDTIITEAGSGTKSYVPLARNTSGVNSIYCDNLPLRKLGWEARVLLREGIREVIKFYKEN